MSSPISHLSLAAVAWPSLRGIRARVIDPLPWWRKGLLLAWVCFALQAPDLDALPAFLGFSSLGASHNGFVHSFTFALLFAPIFAVIARLIAPLPWRGLLLAGFLCYAAHLLTDALTYGRGVMLLWPMTDQRFALPILYGVRHSQPEELLHTLPITIATDLLFGLVVFALFRAVTPLPAPTRMSVARPATSHTPSAPGLAEGSAVARSTGLPWLIDAHVHLHEAFDLAHTFATAIRRFRGAADRLGVTDHFGVTAPPEGVLMLTESAGTDVFGELKSSRQPPPPGWTLVSDDADEDRPAAVRLRRDADGATLLLVAGRQIVTAERLEVLALMCAAALPDGQPIDTVLDWCRQHDAVPVLPWGFGKWIGRRGQVIRRLIEQAQPGELLLGDNAGRLNLGPTPKHLRRGAARGLGILPGSDPLPFRSQRTKVGRYGGLLATRVAKATTSDPRSIDALRRELRALRGWPTTFGRLDTPIEFLWYQTAMQWRKRLGKADKA